MVVAKLLHAVASCLVGPTMATISLGLVGYALLSVRLGRNARFLSLGNVIAAAVMGIIGYYLTNRAIFMFTAALGVPTLDGMGAAGEGAHSQGESVVIDEVPRRTALLAAMIERL